jgi:hypothetical protein
VCIVAIRFRRSIKILLADGHNTNAEYLSLKSRLT